MSSPVMQEQPAIGILHFPFMHDTTIASYSLVSGFLMLRPSLSPFNPTFWLWITLIGSHRHHLARHVIEILGISSYPINLQLRSVIMSAEVISTPEQNSLQTSTTDLCPSKV